LPRGAVWDPLRVSFFGLWGRVPLCWGTGRRRAGCRSVVIWHEYTGEGQGPWQPQDGGALLFDGKRPWPGQVVAMVTPHGHDRPWETKLSPRTVDVEGAPAALEVTLHGRGTTEAKKRQRGRPTKSIYYPDMEGFWLCDNCRIIEDELIFLITLLQARYSAQCLKYIPDSGPRPWPGIRPGRPSQ
jgi:hypothetical protein